MSEAKRRVVVWQAPDGSRNVAAVGFHHDSDREDLDRLRDWAQSQDTLLVIDADVEFEVVHP